MSDDTTDAMCGDFGPYGSLLELIAAERRSVMAPLEVACPAHPGAGVGMPCAPPCPAHPVGTVCAARRTREEQTRPARAEAAEHAERARRAMERAERQMDPRDRQQKRERTVNAAALADAAARARGGQP